MPFHELKNAEKNDIREIIYELAARLSFAGGDPPGEGLAVDGGGDILQCSTCLPSQDKIMSIRKSAHCQYRLPAAIGVRAATRKFHCDPR